MKKLVSLFTLLMVCVFTYAAGPDMSGSTYRDVKSGETLDFYSDKVVYKADGAPISRRGDYSFGSSAGLRQPVGGNKSVKITVSIYVGERTVKLTGAITYDPKTGKPSNLFLNGRYWTKII